MDRTFSKRRYLISTLVAAGAAATLPACSSPELPPEVSDPVVIAEKAPPPISGGTLLITSKDKAVAADADRNVVWIVDLPSREVSSVKLSEGDEPGRVVEDSAGLVHIALRSSGAVVTIDPASAKVVDRTAVCPAPRGLAYDARTDVLHVACAGGELVTLPAAGGAPVRSIRLDRDLRDIAISGDKLLISRFRSAELLAVDAQGKIQNRKLPPNLGSAPIGDDFGFGQRAFSPTVAWRLASLPNGGVAMVHQRGLTTPVIIEQPGGYGGGGRGDCESSIVHPTITSFDRDGNPKLAAAPIIPQSVLPVDIAVDSDGDQVAVVAAGSNKIIRTSLSTLDQDTSSSSDFPSTEKCTNPQETLNVPGEPVAAAFWNGKLIAQTREPAAIYFLSEKSSPVLLPGESVADTGHKLFHRAASESSAIACASCHPEGREDAHVWNFDLIGARRTQSMGGEVLKTAPLHWDGDMSGLAAIMSEVFVNRMGGTAQGPRHINAMSGWMNQMPRLPQSQPAAGEEAAKRGAEVFAQAGCQACHSGEMLTNNTNADVGTGKAFQVPSLLGIANRAPFLHDGCAATLKDRFISPACGGGDKHGKTSNLTEAQIDDLVAYLETL